MSLLRRFNLYTEKRPLRSIVCAVALLYLAWSIVPQDPPNLGVVITAGVSK